MRKSKAMISVFVAMLIVASAMMCAVGSVCYAIDEVEEYPGTNLRDYTSNNNDYDTLTWQYANTGSNAKGSYSEEQDGSIIISPEKGQGKIADSEEGFCFYYTKIDASKQNFYVQATFTITKCTADNQNGFGLICTDTVGKQNSGRYMNYVAMGCYKLGGSNYNLPGGRAVWGYTSPDGTSPSEDAAGMGDSLRESSMNLLSFDEGGGVPANKSGLTYRFALRKSNTGYHSIYLEGPDGSGIKEKLYYNPNKLCSQDQDYVYVGFFASRNVSVKVSDAFITVVDSTTDERKYEEPPTAIPLTLSVLSPSSRGSEDYVYSMKANADGRLEVVDDEQNVYIDNQHVDADTVFSKALDFGSASNVKLITRFYPDNTRITASSDTRSINYYNLPNVNGTVYADPFVLEGTGDGTRNNPVCLADALKFAMPGYTIILKNGTYKLHSKISVERGVNGTASNPITLQGESVGGVVLDYSEATCSNEAFWLAGDYWHIKGIDFVNAPNSSKGLRVSGSYNVIEQCTAHHNTNSGIQISGNSKEGYSLWPHDNLVKNCTSYCNCDETRQDADGFAVKLTVGDNNKLFGCVAYNNIDDGFDLYAKAVTGSIGAVTIENCVAYNNGYFTRADLSDETLTGEGNGFKLGGESMPGKHRLVNSIAFGNGAKGITSNSGPDVIVENCTAYRNDVFANAQGLKTENVSLYAKRPNQTTDFRVTGLISIADSGSINDKFATVNQDEIYSDNNYTWKGNKSQNLAGVQLTDSIFVNKDIEHVNITRTIDGDIDMHGLLQLTDNAPKNAGARITVDENVEQRCKQLFVDAVNDIVEQKTADAMYAGIVNAFRYYGYITDKSAVADYYNKLVEYSENYNDIVIKANNNHEQAENTVLEILLGVFVAVGITASVVAVIKKGGAL